MLTWEREDGRGPWVCDDGGGTGSSQRQLAGYGHACDIVSAKLTMP